MIFGSVFDNFIHGKTTFYTYIAIWSFFALKKGRSMLKHCVGMHLCSPWHMHVFFFPCCVENQVLNHFAPNILIIIRVFMTYIKRRYLEDIGEGYNLQCSSYVSQIIGPIFGTSSSTYNLDRLIQQEVVSSNSHFVNNVD